MQTSKLIENNDITLIENEIYLTDVSTPTESKENVQHAFFMTPESSQHEIDVATEPVNRNPMEQNSLSGPEIMVHNRNEETILVPEEVRIMLYSTCLDLTSLVISL